MKGFFKRDNVDFAVYKSIDKERRQRERDTLFCAYTKEAT